MKSAISATQLLHIPLPALRNAIARHIAFSRGVNCQYDDVVVCNGAQRALDLISRVLTRPGSLVAMEAPGYPPNRGFLLQQAPRDGLLMGFGAIETLDIDLALNRERHSTARRLIDWRRGLSGDWLLVVSGHRPILLRR